ncbi:MULTISPECIES: hypothetical protein [unclassified Streptococcus]|uniref:hypothetical protein n=1 Tax=unclassified Streptococcus TaxID=2608887 RepID=UPI0010723D87|nr:MULTISPECIES: hypothetical protein [unclassified Streptococcus]MBF0788270.1 hypothetical protein [Streptococcus sp. 19428wC2_LYSM12]MCQ9212568.1 hypothetical protein [Streptococcus sp. B01]MCQ9213907.1 hypothetical protein [Streptococcus sp. O1]TFV04640.1 hypothetical protein E4T79_10285 [Streptococcus sp. LYSM12]
MMKKYTLLSVSLLAVLALTTACSKKTSKSDSTTTTSQLSTSTSASSISQPASSTDVAGSSSASPDEVVSDTASASDLADILQDRNTGVTLESGQTTIDYANTILGDKSWLVLEDNYSRTDSVPYNLLQGTDGSLYRVYQNGVIIDMDDAIVHQP